MGARLVLAFLLASGAGRPAWGQVVESPGTTLSRAVDRSLARILNNRDLDRVRGTGFNRDSFSLQGFKGLRKAEDSTIIGWFTGLTAFLNGTDSSDCATLADSVPTLERLSRIHSTIDSQATERWLAHWEQAILASYEGRVRPPVSDEEMLGALFTVMGKMRNIEVQVRTTPNQKTTKPGKKDPFEECRAMREFFTVALEIDEAPRNALFRGLAEAINDKSFFRGAMGGAKQ